MALNKVAQEIFTTLQKDSTTKQQIFMQEGE